MFSIVSSYLASGRGYRWLRGNHHAHSTRSGCGTLLGEGVDGSAGDARQDDAAGSAKFHGSELPKARLYQLSRRRARRSGCLMDGAVAIGALFPHVDLEFAFGAFMFPLSVPSF